MKLIKRKHTNLHTDDRCGVSNKLKKAIQIDVLLTLYVLIKFCLLVIYYKLGLVQRIYCWSQVLIKRSCISLSEHLDEKPHGAALFLGLHCLPQYTFISH